MVSVRELVRAVIERDGGVVDMGLQHLTRAKHQHAARQDRHFNAGLGVSADAAAFLANGEGAEATDLDRFAGFERGTHAIQHRLEQLGRLIARQADLHVDRFGKMCAGDSAHALDARQDCGSRQATLRIKS